LQFGLGNGVGFSNDRNYIDFGVQLFHAHQVQRFQAMTGRTNEVQTDLGARIMVCGQRTFNFQLFLQKRLELCVNVVNDGLERKKMFSKTKNTKEIKN
jgi:hypothetical protein